MESDLQDPRDFVLVLDSESDDDSGDDCAIAVGCVIADRVVNVGLVLA